MNTGAAFEFADVVGKNVEAGFAIAELAFRTDFNQPRVGQFLQVVGDRGLGYRKPCNNSSTRHLVVCRSHFLKNFKPAGIGQCFGNALKLACVHTRDHYT